MTRPLSPPPSLTTKSTNPKDRRGVRRAPLWLLPGPALVHQALAHLDGAAKYGPYNWRTEGVSASVYVAAAMRHLLDWLDGEDFAPDSGVHHLGHVAACVNIILDSIGQGNFVDDRPPPAPTSAYHFAVQRYLHGDLALEGLQRQFLKPEEEVPTDASSTHDAPRARVAGTQPARARPSRKGSAGTQRPRRPRAGGAVRRTQGD